MKSFPQSLSGAERLDLARVAEDWAERLPFLSGFRGFPYRGRSLLEHTQAVMDAVLAALPPALDVDEGPTQKPWWSPMPAAYAAALFLHAGLPLAASSGTARAGAEVPHARDSAVIARSALRELGLPFAVREHAVALVLHQQKALALPRGYAFGETYMRLACRADLRSLYWLMRADALAGRDEGGVAAKLEDFRRQAEALEVFGRPPRPPLDAPKLRALGFEDDAERHRALNALRYFRLVARMYEEQWHTERMRQELATPRGRLHLLVGPAASGKSRWAIEHLAGIHIVSSDQMREELTGDPADQSQNYLVFQRCMDRIRRALHEGRPVAFDATNYCEALRTMPVQAARWSGAEIVSYFFDGGLELALMRNRERRRQVPEDVIRKQHRLLESPALYEADRHMVVYPDGRAEQYWPSPPA